LAERRPIIVYQDDVGNYANELINHLVTQMDIFAIIRKSNMIFKPAKTHCNYMTQRILGHVLNGEGRVPDPKTIEAVTNLQRPRNLTDLRSVIGLFQYAREYIENMSAIMQPIQDLCKKGMDVDKQWNEAIHGVAFDALKIALTTAPILKIADIAKPFRVMVDTCRNGRGIGGILQQKDDE